MTNFTSILPFLTFLPLLFLLQLVDEAEGSPKDLVILWKNTTDGRCEFTIDAGPDRMDVFEVRRFFLYNKRAIFVAGKEPEELWYLKDWEAQKCTSGTDPQDIEAPIPASYQIEHVSIHQHQQPIMDQCANYEPLQVTQTVEQQRNAHHPHPHPKPCRIVRRSEPSAKQPNSAKHLLDTGSSSSSSQSQLLLLQHAPLLQPAPDQQQQQQPFLLYACESKICDMEKLEDHSYFLNPVDKTLHILPECNHTEAWKQCKPSDEGMYKVPFVERELERK